MAVNPVRHRFSPRRSAIIFVALSSLLAPSPSGAHRLPVQTFHASDGLGSSFVSDISQDKAGYIWFATRDGLSRWNGYEFATLNHEAGFSVPAIDRVIQVRSGEYFAVCNDGSLYSYLPPAPGETVRQGKVAFRRRSVRFSGKEVQFTRLYEDRKGTIWAGGQGVLVKALGSSESVIPLRNPSPPTDALVVVTSMVEDAAGSLWIGTNWGLFRLLPDGKMCHYSLQRRTIGDGVQALAVDATGRVWVGHGWLGAVVISPTAAASSRPASEQLAITAVKGRPILIAPRPGKAAALTMGNGLPSNYVSSVLQTSDGQIWIGTNKGLARFDGEDVSYYTEEQGLCDNIIHTLSEDNARQLWVSTPTGAMRVATEGFAGYTLREGLGAEHVVSIGETSQGVVYAVGIDWSINTFDGRRFQARRLPLPTGSSLMWASQAAYLDPRGRWWGLANEGLFLFDRGGAGPGPPAFSAPSRAFTTRDGLPSPHVFRLYQDRSGTLWVGTRSGDPIDDGLVRFDASVQRATVFREADGLPERSAPSAFAEDRDGNLWIGFYRGGIVRYRDGRFRQFTPRDGFPQGMVTSLLLDGRGSLWAASNLSGIARVDDLSSEKPKVRSYSRRDGLASNNVRALAEDRRGRIYAGSVRGVDRLDPATGIVRHYGTNDGLLNDFVTSAVCDSTGDLWFGTYRGVFRLRPGLEREEEEPPISITGLRVAGESLPVWELGQQSVDRMVLGADQRDLA
ncbi:MAG: hypothetical protein EHM13_01105, partial [Acidobacteria bacterium]